MGKMKAEKWVYAKAFSGIPDKSNFKLEEEYLPDNIQDGEVLLEAVYWSVDPYMRIFSENVGGVMMGEQIARVTKSNNSEYPVGIYVSCMVGWRTHTIISDISKLSKLPEMGDLPKSLALGVLGMPGMTAYFGILDICRPKPGETVLINAAAGAVGNVVGQIAKIKGCKVVAFTSTEEKCRWLREDLGFDKVFNYKTTSLEDALTEVKGGIDCYFDNVGGDFTYTVMQHMNKGGRISICGHISDYNAVEETKRTYPYKLILYKLLTVQGIQGWEHTKQWPEALQQMFNWIQKGLIKYRETETIGFRNMPEAFLGLFESANIGKAIVKA